MNLISVVLSTYNRGELLRDAIQSLLQMRAETPTHEIIIVDNNSKDNTRAVVESMIPRSEGRLNYVFEGQQGLSYGRNAGIVASKGDILAFTDDDVRVSPDWLINVARAFAERPDVSYIGGKVLPMWPAPPPDWYSHSSHSSPLALCDNGEMRIDITPQNFVCLVGANLAARREVFRRFGGFDPRYQHMPGAASATEDHEFQARLLRHGCKGLYEPSAVIHAEVQSKRLKIAHHRKWHFDHGRAVIRMSPPGYYFDGGCAYIPINGTAKHVRGVPLYLLRTALDALLVAGKNALKRDREGVAWALHVALESLGSAHYYATVRGRGHDRGLHPGEPPVIP